MNYKKMPPFLYGTAWKKEQTASLVKEALLSGFRGIDTASQPKHYQEKLVGDGIKDSGIKREEIFIQTKFTPIEGQDINNMPYKKESPLDEQIKDSFEVSKRNLQTNFIDSYILHSPIFPAKRLMLAWSVMEEFYEKKEVGQIGISNCYDLDVLKYIYKNSKIKPSVVQNRFYNQTSYDKELRKWCQENEIKYQSFWSLTANPHILGSTTIQNLSLKYSKTPAQIFYRYLNHINIIPLIGTTSKKHMSDDVSIFEFALLDMEIKEISKLL
jgi:diketogulonate reductase-like aldo/keto reductase